MERGYNIHREVEAMSALWTILYVALAIIAIVIILPAFGIALIAGLFEVLLTIGAILLILVVLHWVGVF